MSAFGGKADIGHSRFAKEQLPPITISALRIMSAGFWE
jgi:hypothetical protein